jgi:hypothetical protein
MADKQRTIPERVKVLTPDGTPIRWATEAEAHELIRLRQAEGLGNRRKVYALKLIKQEQAILASKPGRIPVVRMYDLVAPSPRRHFGSKAATYPDMRRSPQRPRYEDKRAAKSWDRKAVALAAKRHAERQMNPAWAAE